MVVHEAVGVAEPIVPFDNRAQDSKKMLPVLVVAEYLIPGIAAGVNGPLRNNGRCPFFLNAQMN